MLSRRTVLVLGAGASVEFRMPAGPQLATTIASKLDLYFDGGVQLSGDTDLFASLRRASPERAQSYFRAGRIIHKGLPLARSIDDFLYIHGADDAVVEVGKAAIVRSILQAEQGSRLNTTNARNADAAFHELQDTWLYKLFSHLMTDVRPAELDQIFGRLRIINFNYDRCVEHFLLNALQHAYSISEQDAAGVVSLLDIVHPYGQVGWLPWQPHPGPRIEFGGGQGTPDPAPLATVIKTYTEQTHDQDEVESWRAKLVQAERIVFLGFAFHRQNMELIAVPSRASGPWPAVYATVLGTSVADREVFSQRIHHVRGEPPPGYSAPHLTSIAAAKFMDEFGLMLAA